MERERTDALAALVSGVRPTDLSQRVLPEARAELNAVRHEAQDATRLILEAVEWILEQVAKGKAVGAEVLEPKAIAILQACAFQDITGQRLAKALALLDDAEAKLVRLAAESGVEDAAEVETEADRRRKALHLHGPALAGPEVGQAAIDALFD